MMTINWATQEILIPQSDLSFVSGTFYTYDTNAARIAMNVLSASEDGMVFPDINSHNTEVSIAGTTYARTIEIINGYNITFENLAYSVQLEGSNNNMWDIGAGILNQNLVQVIPTNSAGLVVVTDSAVTEQDKLDIADRVWDEDQADHVAVGSTGKSLFDSSVPLTPTEIADAVWNALGVDYANVGSFGATLTRILEDVSYPITSQLVVGETHLTIWTDDTLTVEVRKINIGTAENPKRLIVP